MNQFLKSALIGKKSCSVLHRITKLFIAFAIAVLATALIAGCTRYPRGLEKVYGELKEQPVGMGTAALKGRVIVIDPGHGGYFDGALGPDSLREADVNLGVALYLWGLLKEAGANVHLTRSSDRDFLPPGSTELKDDLENRMEIADSFNADVFISIHHNSNLPLNRKTNGIEVYYKSSDTEASLILANDVMKHLTRNLGIDEAAVKPGGYFVLRKSNAVASILGEASYLSNPFVEKKLKLSNKQRLEAESYFFGLVDYFSRGVPRIERVAPEQDTIQASEPLIFRVEEYNGITIDPSSARINIGRTKHQALYLADSSMIYLEPDPSIPNGYYTIDASVASILGGIGKSKRYTLTVARPPAFIIPIRSFSPSSQIIKLKILDALGEPVLDGTSVSVLMNENKSLLITTNGIVAVKLDKQKPTGSLIVTAQDLTDTIYVKGRETEEKICIKVTNRLTGKGIPYPIAIPENGIPINGNSTGEIYLNSEALRGQMLIYSKGFVPALADSLEKAVKNGKVFISLKPLFQGALFGKRISIDPASADPAGSATAEEKTAEDFANLGVSNVLAKILTSAGASVYLTRIGAEPISSDERIFKVNSFKSTIALRLDHVISTGGRLAPFSILHYPGSKNGTYLAESIANDLNRFYGEGTFQIDESARPFLLQTHCPACEILLAPIGSSPGKELISDNRFIRRESFALFDAIVRYFSAEESELASLTIKITRKGSPVVGVPVTVNLVFTKLTDHEGKASFGVVDAGKVVISIRQTEGKSEIVQRSISPQSNEEITVEME